MVSLRGRKRRRPLDQKTLRSPKGQRSGTAYGATETTKPLPSPAPAACRSPLVSHTDLHTRRVLSTGARAGLLWSAALVTTATTAWAGQRVDLTANAYHHEVGDLLMLSATITNEDRTAVKARLTTTVTYPSGASKRVSSKKLTLPASKVTTATVLNGRVPQIAEGVYTFHSQLADARTREMLAQDWEDVHVGAYGESFDIHEFLLLVEGAQYQYSRTYTGQPPTTMSAARSVGAPETNPTFSSDPVWPVRWDYGDGTWVVEFLGTMTESVLLYGWSHSTPEGSMLVKPPLAFPSGKVGECYVQDFDYYNLDGAYASPGGRRIVYEAIESVTVGELQFPRALRIRSLSEDRGGSGLSWHASGLGLVKEVFARGDSTENVIVEILSYSVPGSPSP